MMVSPTKLIVHGATSEPILQSVSRSHSKTEKSEKKNSPLWKARSTKIQGHLTSVHKFSVSRIAGTEWRNQYSNLLLVGTNSCLILLLLICVFLALLMMHCDKSFVKPAVWLRIARPMRDGRPFASSPFRRRVEALFSRFPFLVGYAICALSSSEPDLTRLSAS